MRGDGYARVWGTDTWHQVGAAGEPAFTNGWAAVSGDEPAFRMLPSGKVLVAGGYIRPPPSAEVTKTADIFDPATRMWTPAPDMPTPRGNATATTRLTISSATTPQTR